MKQTHRPKILQNNKSILPQNSINSEKIPCFACLGNTVPASEGDADFLTKINSMQVHIS